MLTYLGSMCIPLVVLNAAFNTPMIMDVVIMDLMTAIPNRRGWRQR